MNMLLDLIYLIALTILILIVWKKLSDWGLALPY